MKLAITSLTMLLLAASATTHAADDPAKDSTRSAEQRIQEAQKRLEEAAREIAELSGRAYVERMPDRLVFLGRNPNRAMLGIGIGDDRDKQSDEGVAVLSVSPGGPAANAGMKTGDVIVELNGKSLQGGKDDSPRAKLLAEMAKLSPGDEANVRYLRNGKAATVKIEVDRLPREAVRTKRIEIPNMDRFQDRARELETFRIFAEGRGPLGDMELVALTPKLGQYFGTDKGLLIVRAPDNKDIKLEDGDVLVDIDGRVPSDPGHAFRILRSYQPGEKLALNVLRQRKKVSVSVALPDRPERGRRAPPPARAPAAGPVPAPTLSPAV
jgi:S1-C subfamily serine protease